MLGMALRWWCAAAAAPAVAVSFDLGMTPPDGSAVLHQLLAVAVVIVVTQALGFVFGRLRQPLVVGEIIAGFILGPSILGALSPSLFGFLFPAPALSFLNIVARVGIVLYMFLAGLELDPALLRNQKAATASIAQFGILVPFAAGILIAAPLYPAFSTAHAAPLHFRIFLGLALAVTAFPVVARILTDRRLHNTAVGAAALSSAAQSDLTIWCLIALLLALIRAREAGAIAAAAMFGSFVLALVVVVRPLM